jgi:HSP20 family protein
MTTIVRWDPRRELPTLQERMIRLFDDALNRTRRPDEDSISAGWAPNVDVREGKDALLIQAELPGLEPKDVQVSVENGVLSIKGSRDFEKATETETYHRVERAYGAFERTFTLPTNVNPENIDATYRHGVLTLTLHKREEAKPKSIAIKVQEK